MTGGDVRTYEAELSEALKELGTPAQLTELKAAAEQLARAAEAPPGPDTAATWQQAVQRWEQARGVLDAVLAAGLLGPLASLPGLRELLGDVERLVREGVHGEATLGPVRLSVAATTLVVQPPTPPGGTVPEPYPVGPYPVGQVAAALSSPFGGGKGLPGGGAIVRLPAGRGYGGALELPLGPVQVSASAVVSVQGGQPSLLAVIGASFTPPVQLSFGFSLDRVGGVLGVNRRADPDALTAAVRSGTAGDVLLAASPPADPLTLLTAVDRLFPARPGSHLFGPSLRLSWLSFGTDGGSLLALDVAVIVEIPSGRVAVLGVARAAIPGLPGLLSLRLDLLGLVDPVEQTVSIDASLVDSHVLGVFEIYGDAAARVCWGTRGYTILSIGGFYPGFNPEPAHFPALRRIGWTLDIPLPVFNMRAEGYFAVTSNTVQLGGRIEMWISLGLEAHGFVELNALVQYRPFHFEAGICGGFSVSYEGFDLASVTLHGTATGPGPVVVRGRMRLKAGPFSHTWSESFTIGGGPADTAASTDALIDLIAVEFADPSNIKAASIADPDVVLDPRPADGMTATVPPTGALEVAQRRAPLGLYVERVDGLPLPHPQGVVIKTPGADVTDRFSPGSYMKLSGAEDLNRPAFDVLPCGRVLSPPDPPLSDFPSTEDKRTVEQIVIRGGVRMSAVRGALVDVDLMMSLSLAARRPPALGDAGPLIRALTETWTVQFATETFDSATAAHQRARRDRSIALAEPDLHAPVDLSGVL